MDEKHIYQHPELLVSDTFFEKNDAAINAAIPNAEAGTIMYTAGYKKLKQKNLTGSWVEITLGGGGGGDTPSINAYDSIKRVKPYLFDTSYTEVDYDYAEAYFAGDAGDLAPYACSTVRKDNFFGRNFDLDYSNWAEFIVRVPAIGNRYASIGFASAIPALTDSVVESGTYNELYKLVPFAVVDGRNEYGVVASTNVVPNDKGSTTGTVPTGVTEKTLCASMLVRFVLDNFKSAASAVHYLKEHVSVFCTESWRQRGYEAHHMIADKNNTYIVEYIDNEMYVTDMSENAPGILAGKAYMTNFHLTDVILNRDNKVYTPADVAGGHKPGVANNISAFGCGLERYNMIVDAYAGAYTKSGMRSLMDSLKYSKAYVTTTAPRWNTELVGHWTAGGLPVTITVDTPATDYIPVFTMANAAYENRTREDDPATWHTMHSAVYDIDKGVIYLITQEDGDEIEISMDYYTKHEIDNLLDAKQEDLKYIEGYGDDPQQYLGNDNGVLKWHKAQFPEGTMTVVENGLVDIAKFANVNVALPEYDGTVV